MTALVDTSVLIDALRGNPAARDAIRRPLEGGELHASEITRFEVLAGVRPSEQHATEGLLGELIWHPVDAQIAAAGAALSREWRPANRGIDFADYLIAATGLHIGAALLTRNIRRFPMIAGLRSPY